MWEVSGWSLLEGGPAEERASKGEGGGGGGEDNVIRNYAGWCV